MLARRGTALTIALVAACYDKPRTPDADTDAGTTTTGTDASESTSTAAESLSTAMAESSGSASTVADTSTTTSVGTSEDTSESGTTTGDLPPICDQQMPTLVACGTGGIEDTPNYGNLACDPTVEDFSVFYEDVYTLDLAEGQCVYVHVDNIGVNGATGVASSDVAFQLRSPSGAYAWQDDDVPCTDPAWTGAACPQAMLTADIAGFYELAIVQASGAGCVSGAEYTLYIAIDGVSAGPAATSEDALLDCTP